ncbi:hypothetical protein [Nocardioides bruguierae]|uniref:Pilus assembly protein n=1 Tax=Nocardioides bruguierae TaxID=2945102 RepID=A0A9X2DA38_9ACTN|nr:hypothetical protein [Nocardioides bruguierae]
MLIVPTVVLVLMLTAQWAVREQAARAVSAAAREGAVAAAAYGGTDALGREAAQATLTVAGDAVGASTIGFDRGPSTVTATVTAAVPRLIPGFGVEVSSQQTAPIESFAS